MTYAGMVPSERSSGSHTKRGAMTKTGPSGHWIDQVAKRRSDKRVVLDMDSSVSPTHGEQEGSVWNGHFVCACYHPLFVFNQHGDLERCALRPGNVHSAAGWEVVLKPVVARSYPGDPRADCRVIANDASREADQDWRKGCQQRPVRRI